MTAIWRNDGAGWKLLSPQGFPDEASLHSLVEQVPEVLPLAGRPQVTIVGREVTLGAGSADLLAVEPSGRLVVIEVKLASNNEARRAVVSQILAYAAALHGLDYEALESVVLGKHLQQRGYAGMVEAVQADDQTGEVDAVAFRSRVEQSLLEGSFRLVLVLDSAPDELVRLVGYLQTLTDKLQIDLIEVSTYTIDGSQVLIPQRVEPEAALRHRRLKPAPSSSTGNLVEGAGDFLAVISSTPSDVKEFLGSVVAWAQELERQGLARLRTFHGKKGKLTTLRIQVLGEEVGLATAWTDSSTGGLQFWRSVFQRRARASLESVNAVLAPESVKDGNSVKQAGPELFRALTEAYREAAAGKLSAG